MKVLDLPGLKRFNTKVNALIDKRIEKVMIAHVLDSANANMVLGADQGPAITRLIDAQANRVTDLYSDITGSLNVRYNADNDYAQIYYNATWNDWKKVGLQALCLYNDGDEYIDVTGGWITRGKAYASNAFVPTAPGMTKNDHGIQFLMTSGAFRSGTICTVNKIDTTKYSLIGIRCTARVIGAQSSVVALAIFPGFAAYQDRVAQFSLAYDNVSLNNELREFDISAIAGEYYIGLFGYTSAASGTIQCDMFDLYLK